VFELPKLKYDYNELEPHIDARTMEIHHSKHHAGYTKNFNAALENTDVEGKSAEEIVAKFKELPTEVQTAVRNNGGGYVNHKLFWEVMSPNGGGHSPMGALMDAINTEFGSFDEFKELFSKAAKTRFGSGWAFLCVDSDKKLCVCSKPNQDTPLMEGKTPILGLDVWEHAYYLKYQNKRPDYVEAFWNVVNWEEVGRRFSEAI
jgi:superoxide dismutase, Fe-Mn family